MRLEVEVEVEEVVFGDVIFHVAGRVHLIFHVAG